MKTLLRKTILLIALIVSGVCGIAQAQYSDATFNGPWFIHPTPLTPYHDSLSYLIFNGSGSIVNGSMFPSPTTGTYSVNSDGSFTGTLTIGGTIYPFGGQLVSQNTAVGGTYVLSRVTNPDALMDTVSGYITSANCGTEYLSFIINHQGQVIETTGPFTVNGGYLLSDSGVFIGHMVTNANPSSHWNEFSIMGYYSNDTLIGKANFDASPGFCDETNTDCFFVRTGSSVGLKEINNEQRIGLLVFPVPSTDRINFVSEEEVDELCLYDIGGREVYRQSFSSKLANAEVQHLEIGMYSYQLKTKSGNIKRGNVVVQH